MYSTGDFVHGRHMSGQVGNGQNGGVRARYSAAARACGRPSFRASHVSYARIGLPNKQGVRALLQVHAFCESGRVFWRRGHQEGRGNH